ncbi:thiamine pyrophosphokinase [Mucilaginibacter phyllosphaerae]|uniref:Thiamine pyrophosphokinase n=1 Tax=Mucilaginibacter phyllosphaerae TaxID=1812349 RepID=A0A4Y8AEC8_9SPHI|nr:thiamine pyrophosphokinase [Mucilaginibacter phyllosphaerae]MBB3970432.1 thiamine pyrophosphokinase [Mucilaginibacter phyllosphaerae]TEW66930.1 thiamine pyrophosphokinase [Mucilaginibacter phyllosphaerae]GGH12861.1 thiamine pyrophosphokinase [Mucilaginibacter phyllosphaerae]
MSSHHIVREKQEPALLLLSLDNFSEELLGQLLEWSPTVLTTPLVAEQMNTYEIKVDIIIADQIDTNLQSDIRQIAQGNASQTEAALIYLIAQDYKAVNIVADAFDLAGITPFAEKINIVIYSGSQKIYAVKPGFSKWKPAGEYIRVLSVSLNLQTSGLKQIGGGDFVTEEDGFITLNFDRGLLFIAEEI